MQFPHATVLACVIASFAVLPAPAQETALDAANALPNTGLPLDDAIVSQIYSAQDLQVMAHLAELADGIGPRLTSSDNLTEACHWAADKFEQWGLENVRMEEWGTFPVGFNRRVMSGRMTSPNKQKLVFTTNSWGAGTDGPTRGAVKLAPTEEQFDALSGSFKDCWVLSSTRPRFDSDGESTGAKLGRYLDKEEILGVIYPGRGELVHTGGRSNIDINNLPTRVSVQLLRSQWTNMHQMLQDGGSVEAEFDLDYEFVPGPIPLYNVIAEIPGESDELVIIGGHIDSWDGARGAQDNGTGTCTTLEAARLLSSLNVKPQRTIRFMLWSGEEQGLLGSRAYIKQHPEELDRISCVLVHDGGTNACAGIYATPAMMDMFEEIFAPIIAYTKDLEDEELRFTLRSVQSLPKGIGSDHDSYLSTENPAPGFFWDQRGKTSYGYIHHTQNDTYDEANATYQEYTSRVVAAAAWRFANASTMVPRDGMLGPKPKRLGVFLADDGVTVNEVRPDGLAVKAGMKKGDRIVSIDEASIKGSNDLRRAMRDAKDKVNITVARGAEQLVFWFDFKNSDAGGK
ncbi:MAG: M20/M25/M40 family metallo-hydrolase [Planctomycetes bacterium]|nr:M20/M25/M40 family metallo-hydrolase [Planctomycetota bacterium]